MLSVSRSSVSDKTKHTFITTYFESIVKCAKSNVVKKSVFPKLHCLDKQTVLPQMIHCENNLIVSWKIVMIDNTIVRFTNKRITLTAFIRNSLISIYKYTVVHC